MLTQTWRNRDIKRLLQENKRLREQCQTLQDKLEQQEAQYDKTVAGYEKRIADLTLLRESKKAEVPMEGTVVLTIGKEPEFYSGEARAFVLDSIKEYLRNIEPDRRRAHVLQSIVDANPEKVLHNKKSKLKQIMKDFTGMSPAKKKELRELGFETVAKDGKLLKHYKLLYHGDARYNATASATGSDHRTGLNLASILIKIAL